MRILVTGATGFIGTYVVRYLLEAGHEVKALIHGEPEETARIKLGTGVELITGDVTRPESLPKAFEGCDCVIHAVAVVGGYGSWQMFERVGVQGTRNVINAAASSRVARFIHVSSITVYGTNSKQFPCTEDMPVEENPEPWNFYARQKVLAEKDVWKAHRAGRLEATVLRPSITLGAGDQNVVGRILKIVKSPFGAIVGTGENRVPCVVVEDLAEAIVRVVSSERTIGKAYNLSGKSHITQKELFALHALAAGLKPVKRRLPRNLLMRVAGLMEGVYRLLGRRDEPFCTRLAITLASWDCLLDCSKAANDLGWEGLRSYKDAINRSVRWYLTQRR